MTLDVSDAATDELSDDDTEESVQSFHNCDDNFAIFMISCT